MQLHLLFIYYNCTFTAVTAVMRPKVFCQKKSFLLLGRYFARDHSFAIAKTAV